MANDDDFIVPGVSLVDDDKELDREVQGFQRVKFRTGEILIEEGSQSDAAYLIVRGKVEVRKGLRGTNPKTLAVLGRGQVVGEMALFDGKPHVATVVAMEPIMATAISRQAFRERVAAMDPVMRSAVMLMVKRSRMMAEMIMESSETVNWQQWQRRYHA